MKQKTKLSKHSKLPIAKLKKKAWDTFSIYVRQKGMDEQGMNECYTCRKQYHWKVLQAGHFIPRTHNATFIDEMNVKPQCFADNIWKRGASHEFSSRLIEEYGLEAFNALIAKGRTIKKFSPSELEALIEKYKLSPN